ncbi:MAG: DUF853 family protein [Clostridia bacterium]|nr:DUF853 family protein [Clostridia bacterium]
MISDGKIYIGLSDKRCYILPSMANRHGLIAGATGTGKTITMKVLAESFSDMGVPVFFSDVKGDLTGMCVPGADNEGMQKRIDYFGIRDSFTYKSYPTRFWDIFGDVGHPIRVTVSDMGPMLLSRLFGLSDVQEGVLSIVFRVADDNGLLLLDLKDLRAMLQFVGDNRAEFTTIYGNVSSASIGAIQRALLKFEDEGGDEIFGEPALDIRDWMRTDIDGRGFINILSSSKLIQSPTVYATFLLWMLTELFEKLPEVGDLPKPRMIFFFDEAHLLFADAPKALVQKIIQVVKLIRSKGVGVYFVTQSPSDIPDEVLAQLSNRVQHCLRAYTPAEQKSVRAAARSFRVNPEFDSETVLMELGVGEALVSFLDEKGIPSIVQRAKILPPQSHMGPADENYVQSLILADEFELKYREGVDRESAYEILMKATEKIEEDRAREEEEAKAAKEAEKEAKKAEKEAKTKEKKSSKYSKTQTAVSKTAQKATTAAASSVARSVSRNLVNTVAGGTKTSGKNIAKRAATSALSSVIRSGASSIIRGLFGNRK